MRLLDMVKSLGEKPEKPVISLVGAGGKTTCAFVLAEELASQGKKVLVTTTTHMENPCFLGKNGVLDGSPESILSARSRGNVVVAGVSGPGGQKMKGLPEGVLEQVLPRFGAAVMEADGSKRHPFKVPASHEPVIAGQTTHILIVAGAAALGRPMGEVCFRLEEAEKILRRAEVIKAEEKFSVNMVLTPGLAGLLLEEGYVKPLKRQYPGAVFGVILNQWETDEISEQLGRRLSVPLITRPSAWSPGKPCFHLHMLAAGLSRRFGSNKLFYEIDKRPMYGWLLDKLKRLANERDDIVSVTVVSRYETILEDARQNQFIPVENRHSELGISSSVKLAVESVPEFHAPGETHHHCFFVSDQPHLRVETVSRFLDGYLRSGKGIGCLAYGSRRGNPVIFHEKYRLELLRLSGDTGGRAVVKAHPEDVFFCRIEDEEELKDYDRPE